MAQTALLLALGLFSGAMSGLIGIGGGVLLTPALVYLLNYSQQQAQGTTLALLLPPISIFAAWVYYQKGYVDVRAAVLICLGFVFGSLLGARLAVELPSGMLSKIFGVAMLGIAIRMIFSGR